MSKKNKSKLSKKAKTILNSVLITSLVSGLGASLLIYILTISNNQKNWCRQEIKSFDYNNYTKKELSMLIQECKDGIKTYGLLEDTLYNSNDTQKFSSIINELYVNGKIDNDFITSFSDEPLIKKINNPNYNFSNRNLYLKNNLPELNKQIEKYLTFTKEILFKSYTNEQQAMYYSVFITLFRGDSLLTNQEVPQFNIYDIESRPIEPKLNRNLLHLHTILENLGKIDKRKFKIESDDKFVLSVAVLFNSYRHKDNKTDLINEVSKLSKIIENNMNREKIGKISNKQWMDNIGRAGAATKIMELILAELANYNLSETELKKLFNSYHKALIYQPMKQILNKLIHKLFTDDILADRNDAKKLYTQLFLKHLQKDYFFGIKREFITYLAIKENTEILQTLLNTFKDDEDFKRKVLHSLVVAHIISRKDSYNILEYEDFIIEIIESEHNEKAKRFLIRDSLVLKDVKVIDYAINYIKENKKHYIKELNETTYHGHQFHFYSIFRYLADSKPSWVAKQKDIKEKKFNLYNEFIHAAKNKESKLYLVDATTSFITKDDIFLVEKLKKTIQKEKDKILQEKMLKELNTIYKRD